MDRTSDGRFLDKRVLITKDYSRKLIMAAKEKTNFTWTQIAKEFNVNPQTIMHDWMKNSKSLPLAIYTRLHKLAGKDIPKRMRTIDAFWGQRMRNGVPKTKKIDIPDMLNPKFAEFYGILLGDGCVFSNMKAVSITGDKLLDRKYYYEFIRNLVHNLFSISPKIYEEKKERTIRCLMYSKALSKILVKRGFPAGIKYSHDITIPKIFFQDKKCLAACIRGLMDTDGSLAPHPHSKIMIHISITIKSLRESTYKALAKLGIESGIYDKGINLYGSDKIKRFYDTIGFSNFRNIYKYQKFTQTGKVPLSKDVETFITSQSEML